MSRFDAVGLRVDFRGVAVGIRVLDCLNFLSRIAWEGMQDGSL